MGATCSYLGCGRPAEAKGLCHPHYRQHQRGRPLTPIRPYRAGASVKLPGVRVPREHAEVLRDVAGGLYEGTKQAVEAFAQAKHDRGREKGGVR